MELLLSLSSLYIFFFLKRGRGGKGIPIPSLPDKTDGDKFPSFSNEVGRKTDPAIVKENPAVFQTLKTKFRGQSEKGRISPNIA